MRSVIVSRQISTDGRLIAAWIAGAALLVAGSWIVNNLKLDVGVSVPNYVMALLIAFILFLIAGLLWISVAVATRLKL
ncbi:MAG: hypothetical protein HYX24_07500 [Candidatus Aenigmarchaeota archaeon]|nr:hypothetical protein [Candidatus Aenigmarchaeota archaeon]